MQLKTCKKCQTEKPLDEYHKSTRCADGYRGACKVCNGKAGRARYDKVYKGGMGHNQGRVLMPAQDKLNAMFELVGGSLVRRVSSGNSAAGSIVGAPRKDGYRRVWVDGAHALVHRLVWKMVTGEEPPYYIDHINGDKSDNRIENMREATHGQNIQNQAIRKSNTSGFNGVRWYEPNDKWLATFTHSGRTSHIGYFDRLKDALIEYEVSVLKAQGEFADMKVAHNRAAAKAIGIEW